MRVLLMGTDTGEDSAATQLLEQEGHDVVRCHPPDAPAFPCAALVDGWQCPLEHDTVHAAVVVASGPTPQADVGADEGSRCALRLHVPLVTVGYDDASPLVPWATESIAGTAELGDAVTRAVSAPMRTHEAVATDALRQVLEIHDIPTAGAHVTVERIDRGLRAELDTEDGLSPKINEIAAVRVLAALRTVDPHASTISVAAGGNVLATGDS